MIARWNASEESVQEDVVEIHFFNEIWQEKLLKKVLPRQNRQPAANLSHIWVKICDGVICLRAVVRNNSCGY